MARSAAVGEVRTSATGHQPTLELGEAFPPEVQAGAEIVVRARVSCPEGCDLRGGLVNIVSSEEVVLTGELGGSESAETAETADLVLKAPAQVGERYGRLRSPGRRSKGSSTRNVLSPSPPPFCHMPPAWLYGVSRRR